MTQPPHIPAQVPWGAHRADRDPSSNRLCLPNDLLLIFLDDFTSKLRVHPRAAGYALAGAILLDLLATKRITITDQHLAVGMHQPPPADDLLRHTWGLLMATPEQTDVTFWVEHLAPTALDRVVERLEATGWIRRCRAVMGGTRYEARDRNAVSWRRGRLICAVCDAQPPVEDVMLYVLVEAAGFVRALLDNAVRVPTPEHLQTVIGQAARDCPSARDVIRAVQDFVARVSLAPR
ncbi:MAG: GPP34 family phosphoprotein [Micromonosporaceae bacterium]|nr:GPP34 family phosphoprotein [Micromonosporaceae bacterium]